MATDYIETKFLIDKILELRPEDVLEGLQTELRQMGRTKQMFHDGVIDHGPRMNFYTSDQWLDFHQKVPHWRLRREKALMDKLSPKHRELLGDL